MELNLEEYENSIMAAGGLLGILLMVVKLQSEIEVEPVVKEGMATNKLILRFPFLKSSYMVTVEQLI